MTLKRQFLFVLLILIGFHSYSQIDIRFGGKIGGNFAGLHSNGSTAITDGFGINIGGIVELGISESFSIQPELLYSQKTGKINIDNGSNTLKTDRDYIEIPANGKIDFFKGLSVEFGPQIGFLINDKNEITNNSNNETEDVNIDDLKSIDLSANLGVSYTFNPGLIIQLRYNYGISKIINEMEEKNSVVMLSLGYFLK